MIRMLSAWKHSGFQVFCGNRISPKDETAMETLARYIIRASFPQERMSYLEKEGSVVYRAKDGKDQKTFLAREWLAAMCATKTSFTFWTGYILYTFLVTNNLVFRQIYGTQNIKPELMTPFPAFSNRKVM